MKSLTVFLDSSVVLSGLASTTGGSGKLLAAGNSGAVRLITSDYVINEISRHLSKLNLKPADLRQWQQGEVRLIKTPSQALVEQFVPLTSDVNDAPVLAGAVMSGAGVLVSLDKKHIVTAKVKRALKPLQVYTPKQFWNWQRKQVK